MITYEVHVNSSHQMSMANDATAIRHDHLYHHALFTCKSFPRNLNATIHYTFFAMHACVPIIHTLPAGAPFMLSPSALLLAIAKLITHLLFLRTLQHLLDQA